MGNIVLLDDLTINKIAAGEVVERPASVVKELVENSIDAGATNISIEIKNGGISYIRITDNGKGIAADDMEIAFERHATSKIRQAEDLDTVKSMGFRGEALASVAAIAKVEMVSKQVDTEIGNRIVVEAGNVLEKNETGCPNGTTITVENLFFNTPVRYKFLKKDYTEAGYIEDAVTRLALINPNIAFKLVSNGKVVVKTYGDNKLNNVIYSIYGKDIASATVDVKYEYEGISVTGVVGKPEIARSNRTNQIFFVNKRYVKDKTLSSATEQAFKGLIPIGKYGYLVLNIEVNPSKVDVNVHPAKLEVRFEEENNVFKAVYHAIRDALLRSELVEDTSKTIDEDETKVMSLSVIESKEKGIFGNLFKGRKKKEDWEIQEENERNNLIANIYNAKYEIANRKNTENKKEEPDNMYKIGKMQLDSMNFEMDTNVMGKIEELHQKVANELHKNPQINYKMTSTFETRKHEEHKEEPSNYIEEIYNKNNMNNSIEEKSEEYIEEKVEENNIDIAEQEKEENSKDVIEQKIESIKPDTTIEEIQKKEQQEKGDFNEMYAKIFGKKISENKENVVEGNNANDIATIEDEKRNAYNSYKKMTENNFSIFDNVKNYAKPNYKFIGIAFSTYIILEIKQELYILDQHAAHERIMYEKVKKNFYSNEDKDSQMLLLPDIINLTYKELDIVKDNWDVFEKAGFQLEYFGENTIKLTGVPDICFDLDTKELFLETLDEINTVARTAKQEIEERFIATVACKAAVKANMALDDEEVHALLEELLRLPNPFTCPHGRPTAIKMNKSDIEKKFARKK